MRQVMLADRPGMFELVVRSTKNSRVRSIVTGEFFLTPTSNISVDFTLQDCLSAVKKYAADHYEDGWDIVVETYTDEEIKEEIKSCSSPAAAIRMMARTVGLLVERRSEIEATAF